MLRSKDTENLAIAQIKSENCFIYALSKGLIIFSVPNIKLFFIKFFYSNSNSSNLIFNSFEILSTSDEVEAY
jgi:hypothetical protein